MLFEKMEKRCAEAEVSFHGGEVTRKQFEWTCLAEISPPEAEVSFHEWTCPAELSPQFLPEAKVIFHGGVVTRKQFKWTCPAEPSPQFLPDQTPTWREQDGRQVACRHCIKYRTACHGADTEVDGRCTQCRKDRTQISLGQILE